MEKKYIDEIFNSMLVSKITHNFADVQRKIEHEIKEANHE